MRRGLFLLARPPPVAAIATGSNIPSQSNQERGSPGRSAGRMQLLPEAGGRQEVDSEAGEVSSGGGDLAEAAM